MKYKFLLFFFLLFSTIFHAQTFETTWDSTINFDGGFSYLKIDTSSTNIWQVGKPNKIYFDLASATQSAIVTDTINYYPKNNYSYFDIAVGKFFEDDNRFMSSVFIELHHKYDTDTLIDGGYITVSYDDGLTWVNIIKDEYDSWEATPRNDFHNRSNLYGLSDKLQNEQVGFSGHSMGWKTTWFGWFILPVSPNPKFISNRSNKNDMIIRFNFISDSLDHLKEGWLIDKINIYTVDVGSKITDILNNSFEVYPNPIRSSAVIKFNTFYQQIDLLIYNSLGQLATTKKCFACSSIEFKNNNLKAGLYTIVAKSRNKLIGIKRININ